MSNVASDAIVGDWELTGNNIYRFTDQGDVFVCGSRIGVWQRVEYRRYLILYLRGRFDGSSDPLEITRDGKWVRGLANDSTRVLERVEGDVDPDSILGNWDYKNGNLVKFTDDGWVDLLGFRSGVWRREGERSFLGIFLRGYFGGASDPIALGENGDSMQGLIGGSRETSKHPRS